MASAHLATNRFVDVARHVAANDHRGARAIWEPLQRFIPRLFEEANPMPIKYCLWRQGLIASPECRLPLTLVSVELAMILDRELAIGTLGSSSGREALALLRLDRVEDAAAAGRTLSADGVAGMLITGRGQFRARVTQLGLERMRLAAVEEALPRIAFVVVPAGTALVAFPFDGVPSPVWAGIEIRRSEVIGNSEVLQAHAPERTLGLVVKLAHQAVADRIHSRASVPAGDETPEGRALRSPGYRIVIQKLQNERAPAHEEKGPIIELHMEHVGRSRSR